MPRRAPLSLHIALLLTERASLPLSLLARDLFGRADRMLANSNPTPTPRFRQMVLANRGGQPQSIYMTELTGDPAAQDEYLCGLGDWIDGAVCSRAGECPGAPTAL